MIGHTKGRGPATRNYGPNVMVAERRPGDAGRIGPWLCRMLQMDFPASTF